jgi:hypothetical protein
MRLWMQEYGRVRLLNALSGFRLLRSITPDMLLMWDRGFHSCEMFRAVRRRGAHALSRLPKLVQPEYLQRLCDGSWLAYLYPKGSRLKRQSERIWVRVIEYTLDFTYPQWLRRATSYGHNLARPIPGKST